MSTEQNKRVADRVPNELIKGNVGIFDEVFDSKYIEHAAPPGMPATIESAKQFFTMFRQTFPDFNYKIENTIAEGEYVVQTLTGSGTMKGPLMGMPATGKKATWTEIHTSRFTDGKIVEHWANVDQ